MQKGQQFFFINYTDPNHILGIWFKNLSFEPLFFDPMFSLIMDVPFTNETRLLCMSTLLSKKQRDNFQVTANGPTIDDIFYIVEDESQFFLAIF